MEIHSWSVAIFIVISDAAALLIVDRHYEDDAATLWLKKYQTQIKDWTKNSCQKEH